MVYPYPQWLTLFIFGMPTYNGTWPAQKLPYLYKFEAPEALDRCMRILSARSSFLTWF